MRASLIITLVAALAACNQDPSAAEQSAEDKRIVEMVRAANEAPPPLEEVIPEAIGFPDMEKADLFGLACSYAPGTSMGARVIARETDAYMKIDGEMVRFAADPGSRILPGNTRSLYNGREFSLRLDIESKVDGEVEDEGEIEGEDAPVAAGSARHEGTIWLRDRWDRNVYTGSGAVSCGA